MKDQARVVIVGGGIFGVSLLYHLTKEGWLDVVLVEKGELTSGSTWHAAGQCPNFIGGLSIGHIHHYGTQLYPALEAETGQSAGWHGCGGIRLATTTDELDWFRHIEGQSKLIGYDMHIIGPDEIARMHPFLETFGVIAGAYTVSDGHVDPSSATQAMAIGARAGGAEIYRNNRVTAINRRPSGDWDVVTENGTITAEHVVNAGGSFADRVGAMVGLKVPIVNMRHQYVVTEAIDELKVRDVELPVIRDPYSSTYLRQEQNGLLIGPYETQGSKACFMDGVHWSFDRELLPPEMDSIMPWLEKATERLPLFGDAGIRQVISGLITHTPDSTFLLGPAAGLRNFWMACGASIGISQGAGAGKYLAQWMVQGQAEINMAPFDPRRFGDWSVGDYALSTSHDEYEQMYTVRQPGEYRDAGRPIRTSPLYEQLKAKGALYAAVAGWERPKCFAPIGATEQYGHRRTNVFQWVAAECRAVRERVGVADISSFAKFDVRGPDAAAMLDTLLANKLPRRQGGIGLAHILTADGMIEGEVTVTRLADDHFYLASAAVAELRDKDFLVHGAGTGQQLQVDNVSDEFGILLVTGPNARALLSPLTDADLGNAAFPWMTAQEITVAGHSLRALRVSYVGELGWELHCPMAGMVALYNAVMAAGVDFGVGDFGAYAMNSLRMEKGYRGWGGELTNEVTPIEADMERFVAMGKGDFIGRDALSARHNEGPRTKLVYLTVSVTDGDCIGNEPVYHDGRLVGVTTSGGFGHAVDQSLAFAYVEPDLAVTDTPLSITVLGERKDARILDQAAYDPDNSRLRA